MTPNSSTDSYYYSKPFLDYAAQSSAYAADKITALLSKLLTPASVLDVGCASGTWLRAWSQQGVEDFLGVDGDYVDRNGLEIPEARFAAADLNIGFDVGRKFDLVQSLEVAEHIQPEASRGFIDTLCRHAGRLVLFSAAPPGQGGEHHVNERSCEFWRNELARHGFVALDLVRPLILGDTKISFWYRYNVILYVRSELVRTLAPDIQASVVPPAMPLNDLSPLPFRFRKAIVRRLPFKVQHGLARLKARLAPTGRF